MMRWRFLRIALLTSLPMWGALAGGALDERLHLGFTTWRAACSSAGLSLATLVDFTFQLMPLAIIGLLTGGLAVLAAGAFLRDRLATDCLAAHAGCAVTLPVALILCAFLPPAVMLAADALLATIAGLLLFALSRRPSRAIGAHP